MKAYRLDWRESHVLEKEGKEEEEEEEEETKDGFEQAVKSKPKERKINKTNTTTRRRRVSIEDAQKFFDEKIAQEREFSERIIEQKNKMLAELCPFTPVVSLRSIELASERTGKNLYAQVKHAASSSELSNTKQDHATDFDNFLERCKAGQRRKEEWKRHKHLIQVEEEMKECSFQPNPDHGTAKEPSEELFEELYRHGLTQKEYRDSVWKANKEFKEMEEMEQCTFVPQVHPVPQDILHPDQLSSTSEKKPSSYVELYRNDKACKLRSTSIKHKRKTQNSKSPEATKVPVDLGTFSNKAFTDYSEIISCIRRLNTLLNEKG